MKTRGGEKPAVSARGALLCASKVDFKRELYDGEHAAIVDAVLFDWVPCARLQDLRPPLPRLKM